MAELTVFDLQRFALHDGPGIRTTIFLKGCPLDCLWCHNPESKRMEAQLAFLEKNCSGCGKCEVVCKEQVHRLENERHFLDYQKCQKCGECVKHCRKHALKIYGQKKSPQELLEIVMKDKDFYETSKGGVTISGGEPMMQFEGLKELLKLLKEKELHICLDTSGFAPTEHYLEIAKYVDIFLFDYKVTGEEKHQKYTGVRPQLILKNLETLCHNKSKIFLRCPIIPGINMEEEHYQAIARLSRAYDAIEQVHLMTYHDMAKGKASQLGEKYPLENIKTIEAEEKRRIYESVESLGCQKLHVS